MTQNNSLTQREQLEQAIAAQERLRGVVDDAILDATIAALREKLAALSPAQSPEQHRRQVTILFMDIVGSTEVVRDLDPEDNLAIMDAALKRLAAPVQRHGGRITRFMGDGFLAVFGDPVTHENDPEMAIRAGLEILKEARAYGEEVAARWQIPKLQVRVGVNTGVVVIGGYAEAGDTLTGKTVNLAARLESAAQPMSLLISQNSYRHVHGIFDVEPQQPILAKGFPEPVPVYAVLRARPWAFRMGRRGVEGVPTSFIGRAAELDALQQAYQARDTQDAPRVVMVVGDAGIGKSRLLDEFSAWLAELSEEPMLMKGRARQEIQGVPFGLWRDLIGAQFGIQEGDQAGAARSKLEAGIGAIRADPDPAPAHFIGGLLGFELPDSPHLAAVREDPQQLRDRGITYLLDYVKAVSSQSPAVLLLEDVHWADDSSLEVLYRMGLGLEGYPMIAVCAARPTLFERRLDWGSAPAFYRQVDLRPLSHQDCRQLVADVLRKVEQMPARLLDRIVGSAEGNPFYIEELVKMLVEDGVVVKGEPTWQVREDRFSQVRVPDTLTGVLQSRLDSLPGGERIVLQQAATAGRVFWEDTIACLNPGKDGDLPGTGERVPGILASQVSDRLEGLVGREMIFHHPDSTFVATREFTFKHAILMEVAYESTLKRVRREYHALVANWLMEQEGDWHTGLHGWIAEHLERAGRGEHARGHLERAGDQAAAAYANEEAAQFYRRALALTPPDDLEARFRLLRSREKICALQGAQEERRQDLDEMAVLADTLGDEGRRAEVALLWARYNEERSAYPEAIEAAQRAIDLARPATSPAAVAAYNTWSRALWKQGALDQARQKAEAGLALAVQGGDRRGEGELQNTLGILAWEQGQLDLALSYYERCLQLAAESGDRRGEGAALNNLGAVSASREDYLQTQAYLERCLDIFREIGDQQVEGRVLGNLGLVAANLGDDDRAQVYYEQGLRISRMTGDLRSEGIKLSNLGWLAARRGDSAAAREHLDRSLALASQTGLIWLEAEALTGLGHALLVQGAVGEARAAYQKALALDRDLEQPHRGMEPLAGLARCELAAGDALGALAFVEEILAYLAEGGTLDGTEEPLRIYLTCFQVLREVKDRRAEELLEAAWRKMQQRAGRLQDEPARRRFLDNVPWHRALQAAWQKSRSAR